MKKKSLPVCAVLLAGGRGTRFWPRSRTRTPKQLLDITGNRSMILETTDRLAPILPHKSLWVVTNQQQAAAVRSELGKVPPRQILSEPVGRNTAAAIGLAAFHIRHAHGDAVMAVLPADSYIGRTADYQRRMRSALALADAPGSLVVLGIPPRRPETGYGYIERGERTSRGAYTVRRFTEKPGPEAARRYIASGRYFWNAGMFFWRASTFLDCLRHFLPRTYGALGKLSETIGTRRYEKTLRSIYPRLKNISVDYAVMEPATREWKAPRSHRPDKKDASKVILLRPERPLDGRTDEHILKFPEELDRPYRVSVVPARIGWSDIGSWQAVYEMLRRSPRANVFTGTHFALESSGNFFWVPKKFVAAIGVDGLAVVETDDALLICAQDHSQDVSEVVAWLETHRLPHLT